MYRFNYKLQRLEIECVVLYRDIIFPTATSHVILEFFSAWHQIYFTLSLVLFAICCYAAAASLDSIQQEIIRFDLLQIKSPLVVSYRLEKWRRCHILICDMVDTIDDCFSPTLFLSVFYALIRIIDLLVNQFITVFFSTRDRRVCGYNLFILCFVCLLDIFNLFIRRSPPL